MHTAILRLEPQGLGPFPIIIMMVVVMVMVVVLVVVMVVMVMVATRQDGSKLNDVDKAAEAARNKQNHN